MSQSAEDEITNVCGQGKKCLTLRYLEFNSFLVNFNYIQ